MTLEEMIQREAREICEENGVYQERAREQVSNCIREALLALGMQRDRHGNPNPIFTELAKRYQD